MRTKRGYFFVVDAFIAGILLFTAIILLLSRTTSVPPTSQAYQLIDGFMDFISHTQVRDISNSVVTALILDGNVTNPSFNVAEQVTEMYDRRQSQGCAFCLNRAKLLVESLTNGSIPQTYGYQYQVNDTIISSRYPEARKDSTVLVAQSLIIYTSKNLTKTVGPYVTQVQVWLG